MVGKRLGLHCLASGLPQPSHKLVFSHFLQKLEVLVIGDVQDFAQVCQKLLLVLHSTKPGMRNSLQ